jgi:hypothetical protein
MSIKDLFGKKSNSILPLSNPEQIGKEVESTEILDSLKREKDKFVPDIDFSEPATFSKFGLASRYYEDSLRAISKTFPYDGSRRERVEWFNSSSLLTNYVFETYYPKYTGYINFGLEYGNILNTVDSTTLTDHVEHIFIKGGPNTYSQTENISKLFGKSNYYDEQHKRQSNLRLDGEDGVTVEFYLKKNDTSGSQKQSIFDLWNSSSFGDSYGRFRIETHPGIMGEENTFYVSFNSGSFGASDVSLNAENIIDSKWHHYAIVAKNKDSQICFQLFQDGVLKDTKTEGTSVDLISGPMLANIGCLITETYSGGPSFGYGKLSGSLDEFRYWKIKRTDKEIARYYFTEVYGGTNTDDANTDLGVYFKFNEGIFDELQPNNRYDRNVIDYSGRISNGIWTGIVSDSRQLGSGLIESGFTQEELAEPVIYLEHPSFLQLSSQFKQTSLIYDQRNNSSIYNSFASWILDSDENNGKTLSELTQIMSEYFDELYFYIKSLNTITDDTYVRTKPLPFSKKLVESRGLNTLDLFSEASVLETYLSRNEKDVYEQKLYDTKNIIYQNIYNNLLYIYRSKGTEKSIRNLLRCFGVDTELLKINLYASDQEFEFEDRSEYTSQKRKYVNFNNPDRFEGTIYQSSDLSESNSLSYLKGDSNAKYFGNTFEAEVVFPRKFDQNEEFYFETNFVTCSLFGMHQPVLSGNYNMWATPDYASVQVFAVKTEKESKDVSFLLSSSHFDIELVSPSFKEVYSEQKWLLSFTLRHEKYPFFGSQIDGMEQGNYILEFSGLNNTMDIITDSFKVSASIAPEIAEQFFSSPKKIYLGSHRQDFTGEAIISADGQPQYSDVKLGSCRYWINYLPDSVLEMHAKDVTSHGPQTFSDNDRFINILGLLVPQSETLALHWNFDLIDQSDNGSGSPVTNLNDAGFDIVDISSGSAEYLHDYGTISNLTRNLHPGRADFFLRNKADVITIDYVPSAKRRLPEILNNDDLVNILEVDDEIYKKTAIPVNYALVIEKSMYQNISEEMLRWIGTIKQFNNLIGKPTDRYEADYKDLQLLKRLFFKNVVQNEPDFEKFVEFFKWIDESVARIILEMIPATLGTTSAASNMIESHILERNKYRHKLPTLEFKTSEPIAAVRAVNELKYDWKFGHAPIPLNENRNCVWWKERSKLNRENREQIFESLKSTYDRKLTTIYDLNIEPIVIIDKSPKDYQLAKIETKIGSGGYLEFDISNIVQEKDCNDNK